MASSGKKDLTHVVKLKNGLTVIVYPDDKAKQTYLQWHIPVGARHELPSQKGMAHFFEHMAYKGTRSWSDEEDFKNKVNELCGVSNAATGYDRTFHWMSVSNGQEKKAIKMLADLGYPNLSEGQVKKEKGVILAERAGNLESDNDLLRFMRVAYPNSYLSYQGNIIGTEDDIQSMTKKGLQDFLNQHYKTADGMIITVVGNVKPKEICNLVEKNFGAIPKGTREKNIPQAKYRGGYISEEKKQQGGLTFNISFPIAGNTGEIEDHTKKMLIANLITDDLNTRLRGNLGIAYMAQALPDLHSKEHGLFHVTAMFSEEHAKKAVPVITQIIRDFPENMSSMPIYRGDNEDELVKLMNPNVFGSKTSLLRFKLKDRKIVGSAIDNSGEIIPGIKDFPFTKFFPPQHRAQAHKLLIRRLPESRLKACLRSAIGDFQREMISPMKRGEQLTNSMYYMGKTVDMGVIEKKIEATLRSTKPTELAKFAKEMFSGRPTINVTGKGTKSVLNENEIRALLSGKPMNVEKIGLGTLVARRPNVAIRQQKFQDRTGEPNSFPDPINATKSAARIAAR